MSTRAEVPNLQVSIEGLLGEAVAPVRADVEDELVRVEEIVNLEQNSSAHLNLDRSKSAQST